MTCSLCVFLPGKLNQLTGGYLYDRHIVEGLRACRGNDHVCELPGCFPLVDETARQAATGLIAALPDYTPIVVDGLALPACVDALQAHAHRLLFVALIHHPLAAETGLSAVDRGALWHIEAQALRLARRVIVTSPHTATALAPYEVPADRTGIVTPGTAPAALSRGSRPGPINLLCVATVVPRKGHDVHFNGRHVAQQIIDAIRHFDAGADLALALGANGVGWNLAAAGC
jgi:hypothetical protein